MSTTWITALGETRAGPRSPTQKEAKAEKRSAQKARGRAGRGSDPNKVTKAEMHEGRPGL